MRVHSIILAIVCLTLPASAADLGIQDTPDEIKDPHRTLREAVEEIRSQYAPGTELSEVLWRRPRLDRPGLGLIIGVSPAIAGQGGEPGAKILAVTPGSPADDAGLEAGDLVVAWNGEPLTAGEADPELAAIAATRELFDRSHQLEEGDTVTLSFLRDGHEHEVNLIAKKVTFAPRLMAGALAPPDLDGSRLPRVAWAPSEAWFIPRGWLDMELAAVNPELGEYFGTDTGVLVVRGPSEKESIGLASGDVILEIGDRAVTSPEHAMRILRSYEPEEKLTIRIVRHGKSMTLTGTVPDTRFRFEYRFPRSETDE
jgi:S1-C subfamily serine protease